MSDTSIADFLKPEGWLSEQPGPRYIRLRQRIQDGISDGILQPDMPLPGERDIAAITSLSRVTVRRAMQELVDRGLVVQRQGSGSFVAGSPQKVEQSLSMLTSFSQDMARRGYEVDSSWLDRGVYTPSPEEVMMLALSSGEMVARLSRLRHADGRPMAIENASIPAHILPNPDVVKSSLYEVMRASGHHPVRAVQRISAVNLEEKDAGLLGVEPGAAALKIVRVSYLANRQIAELTHSFYRGDAYDFVAELKLSQP